MQRDRQPMDFRQLLESGVQFLLELNQVDLAPGRLLRNQRYQARVMFGVEIQVVQTHVRLVLPLLEEVDGLVDRDPVNPGEEAGIALERFERLISLDEGLL